MVGRWIFLLGYPIFRCYVSVRKGNLLNWPTPPSNHESHQNDECWTILAWLKTSQDSHRRGGKNASSFFGWMIILKSKIGFYGFFWCKNQKKIFRNSGIRGLFFVSCLFCWQKFTPTKKIRGESISLRIHFLDPLESVFQPTSWEF